jgi:hypothetical protein
MVAVLWVFWKSDPGWSRVSRYDARLVRVAIASRKFGDQVGTALVTATWFVFLRAVFGLPAAPPRRYWRKADITQPTIPAKSVEIDPEETSPGRGTGRGRL